MKSCPHCGCDLDKPSRSGKPRSVPQHRRYFALLKAAHRHWPESHDFQPQSEEHLRKWLQCKAGYHVCKTVDTAGMTPEQAVSIIANEMAGAEHPFVKASGSRIYIFASRSIDFDTLPHLTACALFDGVAEVIEAETGMKIADIMPPVQQRSSRMAIEKMKLLAASL